MSLKSKITRQKHSSEQLAVILVLNQQNFFYVQIEIQIDVSKFTVETIVQRVLFNLNAFYEKQSHSDHSFKLDT